MVCAPDSWGSGKKGKLQQLGDDGKPLVAPAEEPSHTAAAAADTEAGEVFDHLQTADGDDGDERAALVKKKAMTFKDKGDMPMTIVLSE